MDDDHQSHRARALTLIRARSIVRAKDFSDAGVPLTYLQRLTDAGDLIRLGRGLYQDPLRFGEDAAHSLAEVSRRVPHGVISLLSALRHHGLTTQLPPAVWLTIPHRARTPKIDGVPVEVVRATGAVMTAGVERVMIEGVEVPIFGVAKTIADCFKHRRHVGEDVAIEALRDALAQRKATHGEIMAFAHIDRVASQVAPYLKALA